MAITFVTPEDVTPGSKSSWVDVDTATVPDGATGVLLEFINTDTSNADLDFGVRKNGSTDSREDPIHEESHGWAVIGVDGSGIFEVYAETGMEVWLHGYFGSESVFFTNAVDKSFDSPTSTWTDVDISSDTGGDTAVAAYFEFATGSNSNVNLRKNGSTDNRVPLARRKGFFIVGLDGSEICEAIIEGSQDDLFLVGYATTDITMHTNATDRSSDLSLGSYADLTALPSGAIGGIYNFFDYGDDANDEHYDLRVNGSSRTEQWCTQFAYALAVSEADGNQVVEAFAATGTSGSVFEMGYFESSGGTLYYQSAAGTATSAGAIVRMTATSRAGTLTSAGVLTRQTALDTLVGTLTSAGELDTTIAKLFAGTLTTAGSVAKAVTPSALVGTLTSAGAIAKQTILSYAGTLTTAGVLDATRTALQALAGTLTSSGALVGQGQKVLGGALTSAGTLRGKAAKTLSGALTSAGTLRGKAAKTLSGALTSAGTLRGKAAKTLSGALTSAGSIAKETALSFAGTLTSSGTVDTIRLFLQSVAGTLTSSGTVTKAISIALAGTLTLAGAVAGSLVGAITGIVDLTLAARSTTLTLFERLTSSTLADRDTSLTLGERDETD